MRIFLIIIFIFSLSACSGSGEISERHESKSDLEGIETIQHQGGTDINNINPNIIRQQTETSFRSIKSQEGPAFKPPTSLPGSEVE